MPTELEIAMARSYARKLSNQYRHIPEYYENANCRSLARVNLCRFYCEAASLLAPTKRGNRDARDLFEGTPAQRVGKALMMLRQAEAVRALGKSAHDNIFYAATASLLDVFGVQGVD